MRLTKLLTTPHSNPHSTTLGGSCGVSFPLVYTHDMYTEGKYTEATYFASSARARIDAARGVAALVPPKKVLQPPLRPVVHCIINEMYKTIK